jgi:hypothetical protein
MHLLKHEFSIDLNYNEEGKYVYSEALDTVEKIQNFQPQLYFGTKKVEVKTETERYYILKEVDENDEDDVNEIYISKIFDEDEITLNKVAQPEFIFRSIGCTLYTLDEPQEIKKGKDEIFKYFTEYLTMKVAIDSNLLRKLEQFYRL